MMETALTVIITLAIVAIILALIWAFLISITGDKK